MGNACQTCQEEVGAYIHDPYQRHFANKSTQNQNTSQRNNISINNGNNTPIVSDAPNSSLAKPANIQNASAYIAEIISKQNSDKPFEK